MNELKLPERLNPPEVVGQGKVARLLDALRVRGVRRMVDQLKHGGPEAQRQAAEYIQKLLMAGRYSVSRALIMDLDEVIQGSDDRARRYAIHALISVFDPEADVPLPAFLDTSLCTEDGKNFHARWDLAAIEAYYADRQDQPRLS